MPRPIRFQFPGAVYHIFNRGNRQEHIFLNDEDGTLGSYLGTMGVRPGKGEIGIRDKG